MKNMKSRIENGGYLIMSGAILWRRHDAPPHTRSLSPYHPIWLDLTYSSIINEMTAIF